MLTPRELASQVVEKLKGLIGAEDYARDAGRILFAVAVDGIECWLLPLVFATNMAVHAAGTTGCLNTMNRELLKKNLSPLSNADGTGKNLSVYRSVSEAYARRNRLFAHAERNPSLHVFVEQVEAIRLREKPAAD